MQRIQLLSLHLRTICNLPNYEKIIKTQASTHTFEVRKENIQKFRRNFSRKKEKYESLPRDDCKRKAL